MKSVHGYYFDDGETEASFETFVRKPSNSAGNIALKQLVESLEIHQQYVLCWTAKFCFSNLLRNTLATSDLSIRQTNS